MKTLKRKEIIKAVQELSRLLRVPDGTEMPFTVENRLRALLDQIKRDWYIEA